MKLVLLDQIEKDSVGHAPGIIRQVLLGEDLLPGSVRLSHAIIHPGQAVEAHRHENLCEVFYLLSGTGLLIVDGNETRIGQGNCFMIEAGEEHALLNNGKDDMCLLYFGLFD